jgi:hypothetical protein
MDVKEYNVFHQKSAAHQFATFFLCLSYTCIYCLLTKSLFISYLA